MIPYDFIKDLTNGNSHFVDGKSHLFSLQVLTFWSRRLHRLQLGFGSGKISRVDGQIIADQLQDVPGKGQKIYKANGTKKSEGVRNLPHFESFWYLAESVGTFSPD